MIDNVKGKIITCDNPEYDTLRQVNNLYFNYYPRAIVYVEDYNDIKLTLKWAMEKGIKVRLRCGGNSSEGYCTADNVIVIDVSKLTHFNIDTSNNLVTIGSGFKLKELYAKVYEYGYEFIGGYCPNIGISGISSGGGFSLSSRLYGLTCDNIVEFKMIDYKGELLTANNYVNSDLFWAVRGGGGGNFGVLVEFTFRVYPVDKITSVNIHWTKASIPNIIKELQKFSEIGDNRVCFELSIRNKVVELLGFSHAGLEETKDIIKDILRVDGIVSAQINYEPFIIAIENIEKKVSNKAANKVTSTFINIPWADSAINTLLEYINHPPSSSSFYFNLHCMGGAIKNNLGSNNSFRYRQSVLSLYCGATWKNPVDANENIAWIESIRKGISSYTSGSYVNDRDSFIEDYMFQYYGGNSYCLSSIKRKYNDSDIFDFPQIIK